MIEYYYESFDLPRDYTNKAYAPQIVTNLSGKEDPEANYLHTSRNSALVFKALTNEYDPLISAD